MSHPSPLDESKSTSSLSPVVTSSLQLISQVLPLTLNRHTHWRQSIDEQYREARADVLDAECQLKILLATPRPLVTPSMQAYVEQMQLGIEQLRGVMESVHDTERARADLESLITRATQHPTSLLVLRALILSVGYCVSPLLAVQPEHEDIDKLREWLTEADPLLQAFVESITLEQIRHAGTECAASLVSSLAGCGALHLVPVLQRMADCECRPLLTNGVSYLSELAEQADLHFIDITPLFALFARGMDPTIVDPKVKPASGNEAQPPRSPIEAARAFVADNPEDAADDEPHVQTAFVNLIPASIVQSSSQDPEEEDQRQVELHRNFLRAMIPAWKAHSNAVSSMLLAAAPDRLIPPLVEICAAYLDLEPQR